MTDSALPRLPDDPHLADVTPALLTAMGVPDDGEPTEGAGGSVCPSG